MSKHFNIVLFHPEIPLNTANIIRTCVGTDTRLHLIKPYGFDLSLSDKVFKRGSANYLDLVDLKEYDSWDDFVKINPNEHNYCFITRYGLDIYSNISVGSMEDEIYLIFGSESSGIDKNILEKYKNQTYRIPTSKNVRSLNLGNCAMSVLYECLRQNNFENLECKEPHKIDYLTLED